MKISLIIYLFIYTWNNYDHYAMKMTILQLFCILEGIPHFSYHTVYIYISFLVVEVQSVFGWIVVSTTLFISLVFCFQMSDDTWWWTDPIAHHPVLDRLGKAVVPEVHTAMDPRREVPGPRHSLRVGLLVCPIDRLCFFEWWSSGTSCPQLYARVGGSNSLWVVARHLGWRSLFCCLEW